MRERWSLGRQQKRIVKERPFEAAAAALLLLFPRRTAREGGFLSVGRGPKESLTIFSIGGGTKCEKRLYNGRRGQEEREKKSLFAVV